ncbi:meiotic nuclear division protein 1 homolog isoform X2 [Schistocerca cancellata]|uniref:meiotic nuclear division protein 1 homolog isoform X2 n=1 Tax=Schistocerca cancellata TaxID=274614 RepID=UPI00211748BC|nr:meiotic nuclear division protein 1 homolog isoform X2 [Schistocerca cancellata]
MSKRKGVSAEEKRVRVLQIFYEKKEFFQLKELEKIAPKEKGVIAQSVKDVVQSLVDDGLVDTDKIGTSIYFWAYPSKAKHSRKRKLTDLSNKLEETNKKLKKVKENVETANLGREESDERTTILENIASLKTEEARLKDEIQKYKDSDPEVLEQMKQQIQSCHDHKECIENWINCVLIS